MKACICQYPSQYEWSSYQGYIKRKIKHPWQHTKYILSLITQNPISGSYADYVNNGIDTETDNFYKKAKLLPIIGCKEFTKRILDDIKHEKMAAHSTDINKLIKQHSLQHISFIVTQYFDIDIEKLRNPVRGTKNYPRTIAIYLSKQFGQYTHQKIAEFYRLNANGVGSALSRYERLIINCEEFKCHSDNLLTQLN